MTSQALDSPIFIVGAGRSGTTLIRSLLSAHSRIAVTPETHFLKFAAPHGGLQGRPEDFEAFWSHYISHHRFKDLGVDPGRCRALLDGNGQPAMHAVFRAVLAAYAERCRKPRVGEKTPGHYDYLPEILEHFPDARILVVQRDPRAVVASQLKTPWARAHISRPSLRDGVVIDSRLHRVAHYASQWCEVYESRVPAVSGDRRVQVFSYERLAREPEVELRAICAFIDEAYEGTMLTERSRATVPPPAAEDEMSAGWRNWSAEHNAKTLEPVSTASLEAWRSELSHPEVALVESCCAQGMAEAGYSPIASQLARSVAGAGLPLIDRLERVERKTREVTKRLTGRQIAEP